MAPLVELRRPAGQNLAVKWDRLRVDNHMNDNIDRINQAFARFEDEFVHGVETLIPNPFGVSSTKQPIAMFSGVAEDEDGNALKIANYAISEPRDDGKIGITVEYDLRHTEPCLVKELTGNQSIASGLSFKDVTTWNTSSSIKSRGSVISCDGTNFSVSEAGSYLVMFQEAWQGGGVTYTVFDSAITTSSPYFEDYESVAFTDGRWRKSVTTAELAAGGSFKIHVLQTNGAAAARNLLGGSGFTHISIHRLYNDSTPTGIVRGVLIAA